jgi:OST-HTH/LOTUS domain
MAKIKAALHKLLQSNDGPISLAQLPQYLRQYLNFPLDITKLGFNKLKDIILSFGDEFKIEVRGTNHPFVSLRNKSLDQYSMAFAKMKSNPQYFSDDSYINANKFGMTQVFDFNKSLTTARYFIINALQDFPDGIDTKSLYSLLAGTYNYIFNSQIFGCQNIEEFIEKYLSIELDLIFNKEIGSWRTKLKVPLLNSYKPIHYRFDTFPNANMKEMIPNPNHTNTNSVDISDENPNKQVTYQFVEQLDVHY